MGKKEFNDRVLVKKMVNLLIPLIITNSLSVIIYLIDSVWVGKLIGENGVAILANCYPVTVVVTSIIVAFATAISVLVSQYYGGNETEKIKKIMGFGYIFSFIIGVAIVIIVTIFSDNFLSLLNTPEIIFEDSQNYLILYSVAFIFNFVLFIISESVRAIGDAKIPLIFVGIETVVNIIAVPILIMAGLGISGVGLANIVAKFVVMTIAIIYINKKCELLKINKLYLNFDKFYFKKILAVGIPVMVEQCVIAIVITIETSISNKAGVIGSASYGVVAKWEQVFLVVSQSIQTVITILIGQYIGKKEINKIQSIIINGTKLAAIPTIFIVLIVFVFPKASCSIFINSEEVIKMAVSYFAIVGFAYIFMPLRLMFNGFIIGTSYTHYLLFTSFTASLFEVIVMFTLLNICNLDIMISLGIGIVVYVLTDIILSIGFYFSGIWRKKSRS